MEVKESEKKWVTVGMSEKKWAKVGRNGLVGVGKGMSGSIDVIDVKNLWNKI